MSMGLGQRERKRRVTLLSVPGGAVGGPQRGGGQPAPLCVAGGSSDGWRGQGLWRTQGHPSLSATRRPWSAAGRDLRPAQQTPPFSGPLDDPVPSQLPPASPALHSAVTLWAPGPPLETNSNNNNNKNISQGIRKTGVKFSAQQANLTAVQLL